MTMLGVVFVGNFGFGWAALAGVAGGLAMLAVIYMGRAMGMTRMDLLKTLGTMMPGVSGAMAYVTGLMAHLAMSAAFGLVHVGLLHAFGVASSGDALLWGLGIGAVHGAIVLMAMPMALNLMHPLVRSGEMAAPGVLMRGFGSMTPMGMLAAHIVFGIVTGAVYAGLIG